MTHKFPVYQPSLKGNEKKYVDEYVDSTWISSKGKYIQFFEDSFSKFNDIKYFTAVSNKTVALHLALLSLRIVEKDEVIVPTFTYLASANATPIFVDYHPITCQTDPSKIQEKISSRTTTIMAVHIYGHPCEMNQKKIAKEFKLFMIENCAEAIGSYFEQKHAGSFGDISTFIFLVTKL